MYRGNEGSDVASVGIGSFGGNQTSRSSSRDVDSPYSGVSELRKQALEAVGFLENEIGALRERVSVITIQMPETSAKAGAQPPAPIASDAVSDLRASFARVYELAQNIRYIRTHLDV